MNVALKHNYIQVREHDRRSVGGNQEYFKGRPGFFSKYKHHNGCGIVALGDLMLYLLGKEGKMLRSKGVMYGKDFESVDDYRDYFNTVMRLSKWIPSGLGVSNLFLTLAFNGMCMRLGIPYRGRWGLLRQNIYRNVQKMLERDIPVILCIPYIINPLRKKTMKLKMYIPGKGGEFVRVNGHFVTIIGLETHDNRTFYKVSSWGKIFEIDVDEFDYFAKSVAFGGILGNVLIVRKKKKTA